jgi:hypothetical protein
LAKINVDEEISFEKTAQDGGKVAIQFSANNSCLKALSIFWKILNNMDVDLSHK